MPPASYLIALRNKSSFGVLVLLLNRDNLICYTIKHSVFFQHGVYLVRFSVPPNIGTEPNSNSPHNRQPGSNRPLLRLVCRTPRECGPPDFRDPGLPRFEHVRALHTRGLRLAVPLRVADVPGLRGQRGWLEWLSPDRIPDQQRQEQRLRPGPRGEPCLRLSQLRPLRQRQHARPGGVRLRHDRVRRLHQLRHDLYLGLPVCARRSIHLPKLVEVSADDRYHVSDPPRSVSCGQRPKIVLSKD